MCWRNRCWACPPPPGPRLGLIDWSSLPLPYPSPAVGATGLGFSALGYALSQGTPNGNPFMSMDASNMLLLNVSSYSQMFNTWAFAVVCALLPSGALAERTYHGAYAVFCVITGAFIFPVVSYWVWSPNGWLFKLGFLDSAGVCVCVCWCACVRALVLCYSRFVDTRSCHSCCARGSVQSVVGIRNSHDGPAFRCLRNTGAPLSQAV